MNTIKKAVFQDNSLPRITGTVESADVMNEGFHESWDNASGGTPQISVAVAMSAETGGTSYREGKEGAPDESICPPETASTSYQKIQVISQ